MSVPQSIGIALENAASQEGRARQGAAAMRRTRNWQRKPPAIPVPEGYEVRWDPRYGNRVFRVRP